MQFVRKTDSRNRITIPKEIMQALGRDEIVFNIEFNGDKLTLQPHKIHCATCGKAIQKNYRTVFLCNNCLRGLRHV